MIRPVIIYQYDEVYDDYTNFFLLYISSNLFTSNKLCIVSGYTYPTN